MTDTPESAVSPSLRKTGEEAELDDLEVKIKQLLGQLQDKLPKALEAAKSSTQRRDMLAIFNQALQELTKYTQVTNKEE